MRAHECARALVTRARDPRVPCPPSHLRPPHEPCLFAREPANLFEEVEHAAERVERVLGVDDRVAVQRAEQVAERLWVRRSLLEAQVRTSPTAHACGNDCAVKIRRSRHHASACTLSSTD
eukprot:6203790-Pleurochrysis_carterae.AAC.4